MIAKKEGTGPEPPTPPTTSTVLSEGGTANSYMAPAGKTYSFYALTKGNGTESVGTPAKAELLWETKCGADEMVKNSVVKDVLLDAGFVYFTAVADGNAVIAVKDNEGTILWSWHIWVTDYKPAEEYDTWCSGVQVMNRNLGALSKYPDDGALTFGFFYQWGRKDPFVASSSVKSTSMAATYPPFVTTYKPMGRDVGTVGYTVANPTVFITDEEKTGSWQYSENGKLWGGKKTQYDPCPPGWKVPEKSAWDGWPSYYSSSYGSFDKNNFGFNIGSSYSSPATWWPMPEYRIGTTGLIYIEGDILGVHALRYWTATYMYAGDTPSTPYSYSGDVWLNSSHSSLGISTYTDGAAGFSVRCQKE